MILKLRVFMSLPRRYRLLFRRYDRLRLRVRRTRASIVLRRIVFSYRPSLLLRAILDGLFGPLRLFSSPHLLLLFKI
jgi:hypothetical protein